MNLIKSLPLIFALLSFFQSISQNSEYDLLVNELCETLNASPKNSMPEGGMTSVLEAIGNNPNNKLKEISRQIISNISNEHPDWQENQIIAEYMLKFSFTAIDSCPAYLQFILEAYGECPPENNTLNLVLSKVENHLSSNTTSDYSALNDEVVNIINSTIFENRDSIELDYEDGIANPNLITDINTYLMYNSKEYIKLITYIQYQKMLQSRE